jgi:hypothetical protein
VITRPAIVAAVLAAFVTTTAVPGPQVISHSHTGADQDHAHAVLAREASHEHDDHHHHHGHRHDHDHALAPDDHRHHLTTAAHDPLRHTHVTSPFQPATPPAPPAIEATALVVVEPADSPRAPESRSLDRARSRAPPPSVRI